MYPQVQNLTDAHDTRCISMKQRWKTTSKITLPWFYNKPWLQLSSENSLDMKNPLKVKLGLDQVSTKTRY